MIKVMVVDDSALMRRMLKDIIETDFEIKVVDTAANGKECLEKLNAYPIDVITLDIEMPGMNGLKTLEEIMERKPEPVIIVSAYSKRGADVTIEAITKGAVDFVTKPGGEISLNIEDIKDELISKIKFAARANIVSIKKGLKRKYLKKRLVGTGEMKVVIIAASTGGPKALNIIIPDIPEGINAGFLIIQHMPKGFIPAFASRLNGESALEVSIASELDSLTRGRVFVAPGDFHLRFNEKGKILLTKEPHLHGVRPAADIPMETAADIFKQRVLGVILNGMGRDGTSGAKRIKENGGKVIAQDEETSVVFGMPRSAINAGVVDKILPVDKIAEEIVRIVEG